MFNIDGYITEMNSRVFSSGNNWNISSPEQSIKDINDQFCQLTINFLVNYKQNLNGYKSSFSMHVVSTCAVTQFIKLLKINLMASHA